MGASIELPYEENITIQKFWELANDLLYTKTFYDESTEEYVTKCIKNKLKSFKLSNDKSDGSYSDTTDNEGTATDEDGDDYEDSYCTEDEINTLLVSYITLISNYCDKLCTFQPEEQFYQEVAKFIITFNQYQCNLEFCVRKMLSLLAYIVQSNSNNLRIDLGTIGQATRDQIEFTIESNERFIKIIGWVLYVNYQNEKEAIFEIMKEYQGFETLAGVLSNYAKVSANAKEDDPYISNYSNYLGLFFEFCKTYEFGYDELKTIDYESVKYLFKKLVISTRDQDELNFLRFKTLLILNEQFMVCSYSAQQFHEDTPYENKFFETMIEDNSLFQNFSETLILNFNREEDNVIQILMLKVLYLIFTTSRTCQWFYLNDLKVIVDIVIRELFNLSIVKDESLINTYLRVLYPMLLFSSLKTETYKHDSMLDVLNYLFTAEQSSTTMKRLSERCLLLDVFSRKAQQETPPESRSASEAVTSLGQSNQQTPLPPLPLAHASSSQSSLVSEIESPITNSPIDSTPHLTHLVTSSSSVSIDSKGTARPSRRAAPPPPPPPPRRAYGGNTGNGSELSLSRTKV